LAQVTEPPYADPHVRWCDRESQRWPTYVDAAQGWSAATTLGIKVKEVLNPERVYCEANPFRVENNIGN